MESELEPGMKRVGLGLINIRIRDNPYFFFSSRRRHTRYWRDWSSDVCSSDLKYKMTNFIVDTNVNYFTGRMIEHPELNINSDRSEERRVGKSVDLGGRRIIKKKIFPYSTSICTVSYISFTPLR